jgi:hypothetical protein
LGKLAPAAPTPSEAPHFADGELAAVSPGEFVNVDGRKLPAFATFETSVDFQPHDFSQAVAINVAMAENASSGSVHCSRRECERRRANRSPRLRIRE